MDIFSRKDDHIRITLEKSIQSEDSTWLEYVNLIHNALPELNLQKIDISTTFLKKKMARPILISA